jgi:manganese-transporting P-type ATPase
VVIRRLCLYTDNTRCHALPIRLQVDICLFDKTGTLTTDELVAVGVAPALGVTSVTKTVSKQQSTVASNGGDASLLVGMSAVPAAAVLVLGGCQSLVVVDGRAAGDPVESAAMRAIR